MISLSLLVLPHLSQANDVHKYQLSNGLTIIVQEDHRAPVVISEIWYRVGGSYEPNGITGISHALEHMMFRGTRRYGPGVLERLVAANGGQQNAFTDKDFTAYYQLFSSEKLPLSFKLEADRMQHLSLTPESFSKEIQVILEERRMRVDDDPRETVLERLKAAAFLENPYHHPVIGWENDLRNLSIFDLRQWYKTWYIPNNAILVVVGDVRASEVHRLALKYFGSIPSPPLPAIKPIHDPRPLGQQCLDLYIPAQLPWIVMAYAVPVLRSGINGPDPYVLDLIATLLSSGDNALLSKHLIRGTQIAADANAYYNPFSRLNDLFLLEATPTPIHTLADLETGLLEQIRRLQTEAVDPKELARAKTQILTNRIYQQDSITAVANELGSLAAVGLSTSIRDDYLRQIARVTPEQIQSVAKRYLQPDYLVMARLHPISLHAASPTNQGA